MRTQETIERCNDDRVDRQLKSHELTEILIQYGHLQSDLYELNMLITRSTEKQQESGITGIVICFVPFLFLQGIYAIFKLWFPFVAIALARPIFHQWSGFYGHDGSDAYLLGCFHTMIFAVGVPVIILSLLFYGLYRLNALGPSLPGMPTHLGLSVEGIQLHRRTIFVSWSTGLRKWKDLVSLSIKEKGKRKQKVISLKFKNRATVTIDVDMIRRAPEKEVLANALKALVPANLRSDDLLQLVEKTLPPTPRYTEIWSQALLNKPQRQLLTALEPETSLHEGLYIVKRQLGAGAQGTAYLVEQQSGAPDVVLKEYVLPDHSNMHDRRRALKRLEDEVQILSRLNHKQIVRLHDVFIEDHRAYLVMDLIDGPSLKSLVQSGRRFSQNEVIDLAGQMCSMLEYLHSLSPPLVHQDFTPDNMLLTADNVLKLVDFNVARESAGTKTNLVVGKQCYMPPEQFKGKASERSDIYALGATMFYLLTGEEPEPLSISHPAACNNEVSASLDGIVARATALDLESRYASAAELKADLQELLPSQTVSIASQPVVIPREDAITADNANVISTDNVIRYSKLEAELL